MEFENYIADVSPVNGKLFVGQLPKDITESALSSYFEEFGSIKEISIIRDSNNLSRGCAFVTFFDVSHARNAMESLHEKLQLPNCLNPVQVKFAETQVDKENKLFIGMLPKTFTEQDLHHLFQPFGELREVHVIRSVDGSPKGCAFVKFVSREAALAAIENLNDSIPTGGTRPLVVKFADTKKGPGKKTDYGQESDRQISGKVDQWFPNPPVQNRDHFIVDPTLLRDNRPMMHFTPANNMFPSLFDVNYPPAFNSAYPPANNLGARGPSPVGMRGNPYDFQQFSDPVYHTRPPEGPAGANLFIYHLPRDITDADLATLFAPFGNVISAKVFVDKKTSDSKGFGFVSYDSFESANSAIESMNGFQIGSKRLKVQHKRVGGYSNSYTDEEIYQLPSKTFPPAPSAIAPMDGNNLQFRFDVPSGYQKR